MAINLINLTPHNITIHDNNGTITLPLGPTVARVDTIVNNYGELYIDEWHETNEIGVPWTEEQYYRVTGLPDPMKNTYFVVSRVVAEYTQREDLLVPGELLRDKDGIVIGTLSLTKLVF